MDCSPPGSSVPVILQARILEWVVIPFSKGASLPQDWNWVSCTAGRFFYRLSHQGSPCLEDYNSVIGLTWESQYHLYYF